MSAQIDSNMRSTIKPKKQTSPVLYLLLLTVSLLNLYEIISSDIINNYSPSKWISSLTSSSKNYTSSNLLRIDPRLILQTMNKFGGLLLPSDVEDDLKILEKVCRCKSSYLDIVNRELEIIDFTVLNNETYNGTDQQQPALKISKVLLKWDSYLNPCIDIHLENVEIFVEFSNLLLTKTNWNELADTGFPPTTYYQRSLDDGSVSNDTFVRIGSLNLLGSVKLKLWSKPLNQSISPDLQVNFTSLQEVMDQIRRTSSISTPSISNTKEAKANLPRIRKGCTTTQVYDIISNYTTTKIRNLIKSAMFDVAKTQLLADKNQPMYESISAIKHAKNIFHGAKNIARSYAQKTLDYTDEKFSLNVHNKLSRFGFDNDEIKSIIDASKVAASAAISSWSNQVKSNAFTDGSSNLSLITIDDDITEYENTITISTTANYKDDHLLHWFKTGYRAATEAAMNVFIDKIKAGTSDIGIDGNGDIIQPDEIFYPPF